MSRSKTASFLDHLEELRWRVVKILGVFALASLAFYGFAGRVLDVFIRPVGHVVFTAPGEAFGAYIMVTMLGGFLISLPFTLYHIWAFIGTGLTPDERKYVTLAAPLSLMLFLAGAAFGYFVMIPIAFKFLLSFSSERIVPMISMTHYVTFVGQLVLAFGIVFEMPLILAFLSWIGIASPEFLQHYRRHAIIVILIIAAIVTPPDAVSQMLMAVPMYILYEASIIMCRITYRRHRKA